MTFAKYPVTGGGGGGSGDVVGPATATDSAVVLFDGTTGKLIKDSAILSSAIVLTSGNQTIGGTKTFSSAPSAPSVGLTSATNQLVLGTTNTTTISATAPAASRVYTLPDAGSAADFVLTAGAQTIGGAKTFSTAVIINSTTNQLVLGVTNTVTITSPAPTASRVYTIPDAGGAADFVMTAAIQTIGGTKTFSSAVTINPASNQLVLASGVNQLTLNSGTSAAARTYTIPDAGASASFVMTAGTQTIGGTLTLPATVNYTSAGSIVKSGVGALTITNASAAGLTFAGTGTISAPTGTYTLAGLSLGNDFSVAQTFSAASNQLVLASGVNALTLNSGTSAAARTYTVPDVGTTGTFALLQGAQTFNALKTFSSGVAITGGTAATQVLSVSGTTWTIGNGPTITEAGAATFATSVTSPSIVGGSSVSQVLTIKSTTGIGTSDRIDFVVGNNGAVTGLSIGTAGAVTAGPSASTNLNLAVNGRASVTHGLTFPATANLSADVNTLDDYEEGTWTPSLLFGGAAVGMTYSANRYGHYTKIGNRVFFNCYFALTAKGSSTGIATLSGLPFTSVASASGGFSTVSAWTNGVSRTNSMVTAYVNAAATTIALESTPTNVDAGGAVALSDTHFAATASLMISGHYITAS